MKRKHPEGEQFDPKEGPICFLAGHDHRYEGVIAHPYMLSAINDLASATQLDQLTDQMKAGVKVLFDSGIFALANDHAHQHGITLPEALALAPEDMDGFAALYDRYVEVVSTMGRDSWGYIELDQGGRENKLRTRAKLEALGLKPIPVYHPLNDGWEYFDYLAKRYDRICLGNLVQADYTVRVRLMATTWERRRRYKGLWIHVLGISASELAHAYPFESVDSSGWLGSQRYPCPPDESALGRTCGPTYSRFQYDRNHPDLSTHYRKARRMGGYITAFQQRNWRTHLDRMREVLGIETFHPTGGRPYVPDRQEV